MNTIWLPSLENRSGPKYKALALAIRQGIEQGALQVGEKLPPVRDLAWNLKITPGTVARAYSILTDEGVLSAAVGRGTYVAPPNTQARERAAEQWERVIETPSSDRALSLLSPRLPDMGQASAISEAMRAAASKNTQDLLNYPTRAGFRPAREAVLRMFAPASLKDLHHEDIVLSHGGQNAINLVMQTVLKGERPVVLLEDLSYAGFRRSAELSRASVIGVPSDEKGVIPEALERIISQNANVQLLCTSPEVHNPTGLNTPPERRAAIADVLRRTGVDVLEDDCYRMGENTQEGYRTYLPKQAWYISSISKSLSPALRVGYAIAPQGRAHELRRTADYGFFSLARPLADLIEVLLTDTRTPQLLASIRDETARYVRAAVNQLGRYDLTWDEHVPFLWLRLPQGWRASAFVREAEARGILIRSADEFTLRDSSAPHAVRIAVNAQVSIAQFDHAMAELRSLLDDPREEITI